MFVMPGKDLPPNLKKFMDMKRMVNATHSFLASDLDLPRKPEAGSQ
jgi:hypothetical protein